MNPLTALKMLEGAEVSPTWTLTVLVCVEIVKNVVVRIMVIMAFPVTAMGRWISVVDLII